MSEKLVYTHSGSLLSLSEINWKSWLNAVVLHVVGPGYHCLYQQQTGYSIIITEDFLKKVLEIHTFEKGHPTEVGPCEFLTWCERTWPIWAKLSQKYQKIKSECTGVLVSASAHQ